MKTSCFHPICLFQSVTSKHVQKIFQKQSDKFIHHFLTFLSIFLCFLYTNYTQMSNSEDENEYEPSIRSLETSDKSVSLSDNGDSLSEEQEDGRIWCQNMMSEECILPPPPCFPATGNPGNQLIKIQLI